jgi:hypothetical protein
MRFRKSNVLAFVNDPAHCIDPFHRQPAEVAGEFTLLYVPVDEMVLWGLPCLDRRSEILKRSQESCQTMRGGPAWVEEVWALR